MNSSRRANADLPPPYDNVEVLPFDYFSWFKYTNASSLKRLIESHSIRTIVETGNYFGLSTCYMAKLLPPGGKIYTIDHWLGSGIELSKRCRQFQSILTQENFENAIHHFLKSTEHQTKSYQQFLSNVIYEGLTDVIIPLKMKSIDGVKHLPNTQIDLVYINAQDEESVYNNLVTYYPLIQGRGILCGDNFYPDKWYGVASGIKRFVFERNLTCIAHESFWRIYEAESSENCTGAV